MARVLERATGREVIVLHEQANAGRTILEKFEEHAAHASFAVALLTADDQGGVRTGGDTRLRGRTNHLVTASSAMLGNVDDLDLLRREFYAEDGSFLLQLRVDLHWDRRAFSRLEQAMRRVCAQQESREQLDRWLVEGYWYVSDFVPGHISHPDFPRDEPAEYYKAAVRRLWDLQSWFVTGRSPYLASHHWPDI